MQIVLASRVKHYTIQYNAKDDTRNIQLYLLYMTNYYNMTSCNVETNKKMYKFEGMV